MMVDSATLGEAYLLTEKRKSLTHLIHELTTNHPVNRSELNAWP